VYAVEYTDMAKHAAKLVAANKMDHIVEVIQGSVEEIALPEKGEGLNAYVHRLEPDKCRSVHVYWSMMLQ
jgi:hypothetical protein